MEKPVRLLTKQFVVYCAVLFLTFCNMAVFFQFNDYLTTLPIEAGWSRFLIGIFSLTVLAVRPVISPFLNAENARFWILASSGGIIICLNLYSYGTTLGTMAAVRILQGVANVVLATSVLSGIVAAIPAVRSAQAFGMVSVLTLLPYAVVPPLLKPLCQLVGSFDAVLSVFAGAMILVFPLALFWIPGHTHETNRDDVRIGWDAFVKNVKDLRVILLLVTALLVWASFTPVFYYLKGYGEELGISNAGWFFTLSTLTQIGVRLAGGPFLDRLDKSRSLGISLIWLAAAYGIMTGVSGRTEFYAMGVVLGVRWGLAMPLLSGLMFDISAPKLRALNTNLSMEMFQGGYFVGPVAGGAVLLHWGYSAMFVTGAAVLLVAFLCTIPLMRRQASGT